MIDITLWALPYWLGVIQSWSVIVMLGSSVRFGSIDSSFILPFSKIQIGSSEARFLPLGNLKRLPLSECIVDIWSFAAVILLPSDCDFLQSTSRVSCKDFDIWSFAAVISLPSDCAYLQSTLRASCEGFWRAHPLIVVIDDWLVGRTLLYHLFVDLRLTRSVWYWWGSAWLTLAWGANGTRAWHHRCGLLSLWCPSSRCSPFGPLYLSSLSSVFFVYRLDWKLAALISSCTNQSKQF